jgi:N,N'-diacetyllegionaminate synthase
MRVNIGARSVGDKSPCFIIAEVGVNHNGDPAIAHNMVDAIADAGVDCVKFQTFSAEEFVNSPDSVYEYYSQGKKVTESMLAMFKRLELKRDEFASLFAHARNRGLVPLSTPTDRQAVDLLVELGVEAFKVGSDDLVYAPFLEYVARLGKPVIISTGMANAADIDRAVDVFIKTGNDQLVIMHCSSLYPTPDEEVNLRRMVSLSTIYDYPVGFSDHSQGVTAGLGAAALGASVLEKHFTLDRNMPGPDHWFSSDPQELTSLVAGVRRMENMLGHGRIWPSQEERDMASLCRRSIVLARDVAQGSVLQKSDLAFRRPGTGFMPYDLDRVVGRKTVTSLRAGDILRPAHMEEDHD